MVEDRYRRIYWEQRIQDRIKSLDTMDILYLITTRLRYNGDSISFMKFIVSQLSTPSAIQSIHMKIYDIYYSALKCGLCGDSTPYYNFESFLTQEADTHNQGRYWSRMPKMPFMNLEQALRMIFDDIEYRHLDIYGDIRKAEPISQDFDDDGNVVYY